jgi:hypothetical protein
MPTTAHHQLPMLLLLPHQQQLLRLQLLLLLAATPPTSLGNAPSASCPVAHHFPCATLDRCLPPLQVSFNPNLYVHYTAIIVIFQLKKKK